MRPIFYVLDARGEPLPATRASMDRIESLARNMALRRVGLTTVGSGEVTQVSTVFLMVDHARAAGGPPVLWETAVFVGASGEVKERCSGGREQAEAMHAKWVRIMERQLRVPRRRRVSSPASGEVGKAKNSTEQ